MNKTRQKPRFRTDFSIGAKYLLFFIEKCELIDKCELFTVSLFEADLKVQFRSSPFPLLPKCCFFKKEWLLSLVFIRRNCYNDGTA
ncbi:MAG: hypothetical protein E7655_04270 [Ruminococcaceae bacterium]|nr:hypothetical protein [Oscillospiraceae bacterium]